MDVLLQKAMDERLPVMQFEIIGKTIFQSAKKIRSKSSKKAER